MAAANRVSTVYNEVITSGQNSANRVSDIYNEVISSGQNAANRVSDVYLEIITAPSVQLFGVQFRTNKRR